MKHMIIDNTASTKSDPVRGFYARQKGFNLVEVLVALLVLAVGILGLAALQNFSMATTHQSFQRTQATMSIQDIVDKMRANRSGAINGNYTIASYTNTPPVITSNCAVAPCTESDLANYDMNLWMTHLTSPQVLGLSGQAQILDQGPVNTIGGKTVSRRYQVWVRWVEAGTLNITQSMTVEVP